MSRRNLIFILENSFPYYAGGIENWTYNMVKRLSASYQVTVISENKNFNQNRLYYELPQNVRHIPYFSFRQYRWYGFLNRSYFSLIDYKFRKQSIIRTLSKAISEYEEKDTAVVALSTMAASYAAGVIKKKHKDIMFICSSRGPHGEIMSKRYRLFKKQILKAELYNMSCADIVLTNGYDTQMYYEKKGIESIVMKNGVDFFPFSSDNTGSPYTTSKRVILSVGTLWDIKGIPELISAFGLLVNKGFRDVNLYFAGKGDPTKYIEQARQCGVEEFVHFLGHQKNLIPFYKNANIIACLSGGGGFGMAAIEAMASGRPVVAWDSPIYRQFNTVKKTMLLTEEKNIPKLADSLECILVNECGYKSMCCNAQTLAKEFDWSVVVSDFEKNIQK